MSKIANELKAAEQQRQEHAAHQPTMLSEDPQRSRVPAGEPSRLAPAAQASAVPGTTTSELSASPTSGVAGPQPAAIKLSTFTAHPPESWEQAIELVKQKLAAYEQDVARREAERMRLKAQLVASEQLLTHIEQERQRLQQRQEDTDKLSSSMQVAQEAWRRQLEALRECQLLSHAVQMAEQELQANAALIARVSQSQQLVTEELERYRQRGEMHQKHLEQLRFQLAQALVVTGTTDPSVVETTETTRSAR